MSNQIVRRTFLKYCVLMTGSVVSGTYLLSSASYAAQSGKPPRILVVYFSTPETDNPHNMTREEENSTVVINGKVLGNTQYVAQLIQEMTGGDIFRILPQKPYPTDHRTLVIWPRKNRTRTPARPFREKIESPKLIRHHLYWVSQLVGRHADDFCTRF